MKLAHALCLCLASLTLGSLSAAPPTYRVIDLVGSDDRPNVATAMNQNGWVSGYALADKTRPTAAWVYTPNQGLVFLPDALNGGLRAEAMDGNGRTVGVFLDALGGVRAFAAEPGGQPLELGGSGKGADFTPQAVNGSGQVAGFNTHADVQRAFLYTPVEGYRFLTAPLGSDWVPVAAHAIDALGRVAGVGAFPNGLQHAFVSEPGGLSLRDLGTLGGEESEAHAINDQGQVVGESVSVTGDTHAFLYSDAAGLRDLDTLGGASSVGFGVDAQGRVVGSSQTLRGEDHAFVWSTDDGMVDLNGRIPVNSGWILSEARALNASGWIAGNGTLNGRARAFLLIPYAGPDTEPPVAAITAAPLTQPSASAYLFDVRFWDNVGIEAASIGTNIIRVDGPNGYSQLATRNGAAPLHDALQLTSSFFVTPPNGLWNGTNNGIYTVSMEGGQVRDLSSNVMPAQVIGTFVIAAETIPTIALSGGFVTTPGENTSFTLMAHGSVPYDASDLFTFVVDWEGDGLHQETFRGTNGMVLTHAFNGLGLHTVIISGKDPHGIASLPSTSFTTVANTPSERAWQAGVSLASGRNNAIAIDAGGTLILVGGLPVKSNVGQVQSLAPGAAAWVDQRRLPAATTGLGGGYDALHRIVLFGGIDAGAPTPNVGGYVYSPTSGKGASIASKHFAVHSFAFVTDSLGRLYSIGGSTASGLVGAGSSGVERYDATLNTWTTLSPLPAARVRAAAAVDGNGHIVVFGGIDPELGAQSRSVFVYDIGSNTWAQKSDLPFAPLDGQSAAGGAGGLVYLFGGETPGVLGSSVNATYVHDPGQDIWFTGPNLAQARSFAGAVSAADGFIYVIGGLNTAVGGNNGLSTVEKMNGARLSAPRIVSTPFTEGMVGIPYNYRLVVDAAPRPSYALIEGPENATFDATTGWLSWTPTAQQIGTHRFQVGTSNSLGHLEQIFTVKVRSSDITPPTAPTNLFVFSRRQDGITFSWSAATDDVGVHHYQLYRLFRGSRSSHWGVAVDNLTNRSVFYPIVGGASFAVAAVDAAGNVSPRSATLAASSTPIPVIAHAILAEPVQIIQGSSFFFTLSATALPAPGFTAFSGPSGMTFTPTSGKDTNSAYAVVQWMPTDAQLGTNTFSATATNLNATATTIFTVIVLPSTTDTLAPTPVGLLVAEGATWDRCRLRWTPAGDNIGIGSYAIKAIHIGGLGTSNHVLTLSIDGSVTNAVLAGLLPSAGYTISITPADTSGNVGASTSVFVTTTAQPSLSLSIGPGSSPDTLLLAWGGVPPAAQVAVEASDSIAPSQWVTVVAARSGVLSGMSATVPVDPSHSHRLYRLRLDP